jgi:hypothetical protein
VLALLFALLAAACSPSNPPATASTSIPPTSPFNTSAAAGVRRTLPPTWTATPTPTPSNTWTPTVPPTPEPTLSLDDLCASLTVDFPYEEGHIFASDDSLLLVFGTTERALTSQIYAVTATPVDPSAAHTPEPTRPPAILSEPILVRFEATHRESGEALGAEAVGGEVMAMELPVSQLGQPGAYDWTVSIFVNSLGKQCVHSGTFEVAEATDEP